MTIDDIIAYEKIEARMARRRASEVSEILDLPDTGEISIHETIVTLLEQLKEMQDGIIGEMMKKKTAEEILEIIGEIRKCQFYCMADLCPGKKDCATCALEYIEKRIKEVFKCKQV